MSGPCYRPPRRPWRALAAALGVAAALSLAACAARGPEVRPPVGAAGGPAGGPAGSAATGAATGAATPGKQASGAAAQAFSTTPGQPTAPSQRQFRLGSAANALVTQALTQAGAGEYVAAGATLERALRIEPDNPLLWIELGRLQMQQGNAAQADGMGRKALALATGDPGTQASAWSLIADSLRARGRNPEAADADRRAASLTPR